MAERTAETQNRADSSKRRMLLMMVTGSIIIFFTGFIHVWSIYVPYIMNLTNWQQNQITLAFYLANCFFVVGNIIGGKLNSTIGAKKTVAIGGAIFTAGIILSGIFLGTSLWLLYLTYGAIMSIGSGFVYTVILDTAQKWFPERTGFASGVIVTSNGLCAFVMAPVSRALLAAAGPQKALIVTGFLVGAAWLLSTIFFSVPLKTADSDAQIKTAAVSAQRQYTPSEMLRTGKYYLLVLGFFFALMPYYLISPVSQTFQTDHGISASVAVLSVMLGSLVNAGFRFVLPSLADKIGRFTCVFGILIVSVVSMLSLAFGRGYLITAGVVLAYGCFGGIMGNFPSLTSLVFGLENAGLNYSFVMIGMIISALSAPVITGLLNGIGIAGGSLYFFGAASAVIALVFLSAVKAKA